MITRMSVLLLAAAGLAQSAAAGETRIERSQTCVCTSGGGPPADGTKWEMKGPPGEGGGDDDVNVQVFKNGDVEEQRVVIIRRSHGDGADTNKDGKVARKEFLSRAEKHFDEMDKNDDGSLSKEEARPPMPPMPPMPPVPPVPPAPPQH